MIIGTIMAVFMLVVARHYLHTQASASEWICMIGPLGFLGIFLDFCEGHLTFDFLSQLSSSREYSISCLRIVQLPSRLYLTFLPDLHHSAYSSW